jgi:nucleoside 2-deoxyribosyltransferase
MSRVYLSVPIISKRDLDKAQLLLKTIEDMGHRVISRWVTSPDLGYTLTPREVFERDVKGVKESDILVAEISEPSHGVGMEIMLAYMQRKKIVCTFIKGSAVSRMIRGLPEAFLIEYASEDEAVEKLGKLL